MDTYVSRRAASRILATAGLALAAVRALGRTFAAPAGHATTVTENANVRSGPGTTYPVVTVVPKGGVVELTSRQENDFQGVTFKGKNGWVYGPLIATYRAPGGASLVGEAFATDSMVLLAGPGNDHTALCEVASGAPLNVSNTVQNGFRYVVHDGVAGWMPDAFVAWRSSGKEKTSVLTTTGLNLRAEPTTSSRVLLVMPAGSSVTAVNGTSGGFRKVHFKGTTGWAATDYLV
jgi:uncharacterized protein YraI